MPRVGQKCRAWTTKDRQVVQDHYGRHARKERWPVARIATELNLPRRYVYKAAARFGMTFATSRKHLTPADKAAMAVLYKNGATDNQIALAVDRCRGTVRAWRKATGRPAQHTAGSHHRIEYRLKGLVQDDRFP